MATFKKNMPACTTCACPGGGGGSGCLIAGSPLVNVPARDLIMTWYPKQYTGPILPGGSNCTSDATPCGAVTSTLIYSTSSGSPTWDMPLAPTGCTNPDTTDCAFHRFYATCSFGNFALFFEASATNPTSGGGNCAAFGGRMPAITSRSASPFMVAYGTPGVWDTGAGSCYWLFGWGVLT